MHAEAPTKAEAAESTDSDRIERLSALGFALAQKRSEAIQARKASGIEQEWAEDEEFYNGIDDANRKEESAWRTKPPGQIQAGEQGATRSTVFVNITAPYVDTAAASMSDMLLPTGDRSWSIKPTPVPELMDLAKGKLSRAMLLAVAEMYPTRPALPQPMAQPPAGQMPAQGMPPQNGQPPEPQPVAPNAPPQNGPMGAQQFIAEQVARAKAMVDASTAAAEKAQKRIEDWQNECQYNKVLREQINDAARTGTGIIKGPVPVKQTGVMFKDGAMVIEEKIVPSTVLVACWNFYPDANCGENIHEGTHVFERDELTIRGLHDLKGVPGYISSQIDHCIKEGPQTAIENPDNKVDGFTLPNKGGKFEVWYYYGYLDKEDLLASGVEIEGEILTTPAVITMVNNRVIRASLNPLDSGDFPYDVMRWSRRKGHWAGRGVARQIRTPQKMVNSGWRSLMDNAGIASGPMLVFRQGVVEPYGGVAEFRPRKVWMLAEDADERIRAEDAIGTIKVDMMVNELLTIIKEAMNVAEIVTGLPMLMQGQQGRAPDTLGGMQMLNNNSSVVRRRIAKIMDDDVTEPHVRRYYRWLLQYGEDDSEKGDFVIDARGSSALVQRDIETQSIGEMANLVTNREFRVDPARWYAEWCKGRHLDPKRFQYTEDEFAKLPPPAPDPSIQVAQLRIEERKMMLGAEQQQSELDRQLEAWQTKLQATMDAEELDGEQAVKIQGLKAKLFEITAKLRTQIEEGRLNRMQADDHVVAGHAVKMASTRQALSPPTEPSGRAPVGQSWTA